MAAYAYVRLAGRIIHPSHNAFSSPDVRAASISVYRTHYVVTASRPATVLPFPLSLPPLAYLLASFVRPLTQVGQLQ